MTQPKPITICVDFDGTIVEHACPFIGQPVPGALTVLQWLSHLPEVRLILYTMRHGVTEKQAAEFCTKNGIKLWGVNHNHKQAEWTTSPKVHADYYIDDRAIGCPLVRPHDRRPYVDWVEIVPHLAGLGFILPKERWEVVVHESQQADIRDYESRKRRATSILGE